MRRPVTLAVLAFLLLAGGPRTFGADEDLTSVVRALGGPDARGRGAAYATLVHTLDPAALRPLRQQLPGFDTVGQWYGVLVLDRYPWARAERSWRTLAAATSPFLRLAAGLALGRHGDARGFDHAAAALIEKGVAPAARVYMLLRLGHAPPETVLVSVRALLVPGQDLSVLLQALTILHAEQDRAAIGYARRVLADPRPDAQAMVAAYLYDLGDVARAKELVASLGQGIAYPEFGFVARVLSGNRRVTEEILQAVADHLAKEANPTALVQQIQFLSRFQFRPARPALLALLTHPNAAVARAAFDVLVTLSGPLKDDTLLPLLNGSDIDRRLWAAEALRQRDDMAGIATVIYILQAGDVTQRRNAARILGTYANDLAVEPLLDALADEHPEVRQAAATALQRLFHVLFPYRTVVLAKAGYRATGPAERRQAAIQAIRTWWETNRTKDW